MSCAVHDLAGLPKPAPVSVNEIAIARDAIAREMQNHPASKPILAWQAAARALVVRELLLQEARRLAIEPLPASDGEGRRETDEEALIRQLVEKEVHTPQADEPACRRYFERNRRRFRSPDLFMVRHILIAAPPNGIAARAAAGERARALVAELQRNPSRFAELAEKSSDCPSRATGGCLGQIGPGQTVPELERALGRLPVGEVAPAPVESRYGFHVVLVDQRIEGRDLPYELVRERIAAWLAEKARRIAIKQYLSILAGRADIRGVELAAASSPLVQ